MKKLYFLVCFLGIMLVCVYVKISVGSVGYSVSCHYCDTSTKAPSTYCVKGAKVKCILYNTPGHMLHALTAEVTSDPPPDVSKCKFWLFHNCKKTFPCKATCSVCFLQTTEVDAVGVNECQ